MISQKQLQHLSLHLRKESVVSCHLSEPTQLQGTMTYPYAPYSFESPVSIEGTVILRDLEITPTDAASTSNYTVNCGFGERICEEREPSKTCFLLAQASLRTEPSELVLGINKPAKEEHYLQIRPIHRPLECCTISME